MMIVLESAALPGMPVMVLSAREYVAVFLRDIISQGSIICTVLLITPLTIKADHNRLIF
jgi:hypothetical protein